MAGTDSTRERIVAAAAAEFAAHGIAGARVDRIAKAARTSKERVYAHFRSKEALYGFVAAQALGVAAEAIAMDPTDLPAYAGRLLDYFAAHPEHYRLIQWGRLELGTGPDDDAPGPYAGTILPKIEAIRRAQLAGDLDPSWDPGDVLALVSQIAMTHLDQPGVAAVARHAATDPALAARRAAAVRAVRLLFPPSHAGR